MGGITSICGKSAGRPGESKKCLIGMAATSVVSLLVVCVCSYLDVHTGCRFGLHSFFTDGPSLSWSWLPVGFAGLSLLSGAYAFGLHAIGRDKWGWSAGKCLCRFAVLFGGIFLALFPSIAGTHFDPKDFAGKAWEQFLNPSALFQVGGLGAGILSFANFNVEQERFEQLPSWVQEPWTDSKRTVTEKVFDKQITDRPDPPAGQPQGKGENELWLRLQKAKGRQRWEPLIDQPAFGTPVKISGLTGATQLNGKVGLIVQIVNDNYGVQIFNDNGKSELIAVQPINLLS